MQLESSSPELQRAFFSNIEKFSPEDQPDSYEFIEVFRMMVSDEPSCLVKRVIFQHLSMFREVFSYPSFDNTFRFFSEIFNREVCDNPDHNQKISFLNTVDVCIHLRDDVPEYVWEELFDVINDEESDEYVFCWLFGIRFIIREMKIRNVLEDEFKWSFLESEEEDETEYESAYHFRMTFKLDNISTYNAVSFTDLFYYKEISDELLCEFAEISVNTPFYSYDNVCLLHMIMNVEFVDYDYVLADNITPEEFVRIYYGKILSIRYFDTLLHEKSEDSSFPALFSEECKFFQISENAIFERMNVLSESGRLSEIRYLGLDIQKTFEVALRYGKKFSLESWDQFLFENWADISPKLSEYLSQKDKLKFLYYSTYDDKPILPFIAANSIVFETVAPDHKIYIRNRRAYFQGPGVESKFAFSCKESFSYLQRYLPFEYLRYFQPPYLRTLETKVCFVSEKLVSRGVFIHWSMLGCRMHLMRKELMNLIKAYINAGDFYSPIRFLQENTSQFYFNAILEEFAKNGTYVNWEEIFLNISTQRINEMLVSFLDTHIWQTDLPEEAKTEVLDSYLKSCVSVCDQKTLFNLFSTLSSKKKIFSPKVMLKLSTMAFKEKEIKGILFELLCFEEKDDVRLKQLLFSLNGKENYTDEECTRYRNALRNYSRQMQEIGKVNEIFDKGKKPVNQMVLDLTDFNELPKFDLFYDGSYVFSYSKDRQSLVRGINPYTNVPFPSETLTRLNTGLRLFNIAYSYIDFLGGVNLDPEVVISEKIQRKIKDKYPSAKQILLYKDNYYALLHSLEHYKTPMDFSEKEKENIKNYYNLCEILLEKISSNQNLDILGDFLVKYNHEFVIESVAPRRLLGDSKKDNLRNNYLPFIESDLDREISSVYSNLI